MLVWCIDGLVQDYSKLNLQERENMTCVVNFNINIWFDYIWLVFNYKYIKNCKMLITTLESATKVILPSSEQSSKYNLALSPRYMRSSATCNGYKSSLTRMCCCDLKPIKQTKSNNSHILFVTWAIRRTLIKFGRSGYMHIEVCYCCSCGNNKEVRDKKSNFTVHYF